MKPEPTQRDPKTKLTPPPIRRCHSGWSSPPTYTTNQTIISPITRTLRYIKKKLANRPDRPDMLCTPYKDYFRVDPPRISRPIGVADGLSDDIPIQNGIATACAARLTRLLRTDVLDHGAQRQYRVRTWEARPSQKGSSVQRLPSPDAHRFHNTWHPVSGQHCMDLAQASSCSMQVSNLYVSAHKK